MAIATIGLVRALVWVALGAVEEEVTLTVKDDGIGFPEELEPGGGMGLHIMNYRAGMIGGLLEIQPDWSQGTVVTCVFPIPDHE